MLWLDPTKFVSYRTKLPTLNPKKKSEWEKFEDESNSNGAGSNLGQELLCPKLSQKLSTGKHSEKGLKSLSASGVQIFLRVVPQHHFLPLEGKGFKSTHLWFFSFSLCFSLIKKSNLWSQEKAAILNTCCSKSCRHLTYTGTTRLRESIHSIMN